MAGLLVSASTGAIGSLLGKLGAMLTDEYKLLKGVREDIKFLKDELETMQAFLLVMADVEEPDPQAKLRANAIRELSYEIEDKIDKFMLLVDHESSSNSEGFRELCRKSMNKITKIKKRHRIAKDVKDIKSQLKEVTDRFARHKIDESCKRRNAKIDPRMLAVYKDTSELVGIDGPRDELAKWLSYEKGESTHQVKVASIVGSGGLGKTTLARQVYNKLGHYFECRAFVSVSRSPDMTTILSSILSQLRNEDYNGTGDPQLTINKIRNFLEDKRYFIIIDDLWDMKTWRNLDCALFKNKCGSVIITTTRIHEVAESCCSSKDELVYKIQPLGVADSKKLFFKRIFGCEEKCPQNLKDASEDILKKCGGLPLAINAISSLLATGKTKEEWERLRLSIGFAQGNNSEIDAMNYILSLSYLDLPLHLRSCLLYLTMFPEDYSIGRERLVHRWISEGFIHGESGEDLVELGMTYFNELINRSLILPMNIQYDGKPSSCRVHDTILDFLIYKSAEENFCTLLSNHVMPDIRVRRLSLIRNEDQGSVKQLDLSHVRSLGVFCNAEQLPSLVKCNVLRVLDLELCYGLGYHHLRDIGRLFQLRYLNLTTTGISKLPRQIGDLMYLETLDASNTNIVELPESVTRLKRLTHLFVPLDTKFPDGIGNMEKLQQLGKLIHMFKQSVKFLEELGKLINLRRLSITWDPDESDTYCYKREMLVSSLCRLDRGKLHSLSIRFCLTENDTTSIAGHPFFFPALQSIRDVLVRKGKLCWINTWLISLVSIEKLSLCESEIEQQHVEMVGSIPTLLSFTCSPGGVGPIVIRSGLFQQLGEFYLYDLCVGFMFEAGAMPNLKELFLEVELSVFDGGFDYFGIHHLSSLASICIHIVCAGVRAADVEAAEVSFKSIADVHPNRPTLEIFRLCEEDTLQDDDSDDVMSEDDEDKLEDNEEEFFEDADEEFFEDADEEMFEADEEE